MQARVSKKGQLVLPAKIRQQDGTKPGQQFQIERINRGQYHFGSRDAAPNEGLADWLLACPEKGHFVPIASESTDRL